MSDRSFGWKQAIAEFQRAQELDRDFAMAYWGEVLCYSHPLFRTQALEKPGEACTSPVGWKCTAPAGDAALHTRAASLGPGRNRTRQAPARKRRAEPESRGTR